MMYSQIKLIKKACTELDYCLQCIIMKTGLIFLITALCTVFSCWSLRFLECYLLLQYFYKYSTALYLEFDFSRLQSKLQYCILDNVENYCFILDLYSIMYCVLNIKNQNILEFQINHDNSFTACHKNYSGFLPYNIDIV